MWRYEEVEEEEEMKGGALKRGDGNRKACPEGSRRDL